MSQRNYQPLIKHLYKQSRSKLPIDIWVHAVGSKLAVVKPDEIYEPIVMRVKTTGKFTTLARLRRASGGRGELMYTMTNVHVPGKLASPDGTVKYTVNPDEKDW
jgi:hypothetical protein